MSTVVPPPSCCASLRQTLMQGWQQGFPLHPSPFRQMAARSGATPRELLAACRELHRSGALQQIRARWGDTMLRERWRLAFAPRGVAAAAALTTALARLPGCYRIENAQAAPPLPSVWAEIEAIDEAALLSQLRRLPCPPKARLRLTEPQAAASLACEDPDLAASLERGLSLCARPFSDCARRLGRSEHRLLSSLQAWRRTGQLECLTLKPPPTRVPLPGVLALWQRFTPSPALLAQLQQHRSVDRVVVGPGTPEWPWRLALVLRATPQLGFEQLRALLAELGVDEAPDARVRLLVEQPRDQALLFDTGG